MRTVDNGRNTATDATGTTLAHRLESAVILLPVLATAAFLWRFGVNVPYFDEWDLAPLVDLVARGQATFGDYYEQHGVHRILVPKFFLSQLAVATGWNVVLEMFINLGLVLATLPAFLILSRRTLQVERRDRTLISLSVSAVLFAPIAVDSWLSGWHIGWFLTNACVAWAVVIVTSSRPRATTRFGIAALLCLVASFSIAHGLASWLALIPVIAVSFRRRVLALTLWSAFFVLSTIAYFTGYVPSHPELPTSLAERMGTMVFYFLAVIGSPLGGTRWVAIPAGAILVTLITVFAIRSLRNGSWHLAVPWFTLALYVLSFAAANAVGRAGWGVERALSAPYKLVSALFLIVLLHMAALDPTSSDKRIRAVRRIAWAIIAVMVVGSASVIPHAAQQRALRSDAALCLQTALLIDSDTPACRPALAWSYRDPLAEARHLHRSGVFDLPDRQSFSDQLARGRIDVEASGWEPFAKTGRRFVVRGSFETAGTDRTLLLLTTGSPPHVIATQLESHAGQPTVDWVAELPLGAAVPGRIRAWIYDDRSRSFRGLRNELETAGLRVVAPPA